MRDMLILTGQRSVVRVFDPAASDCFFGLATTLISSVISMAM